MQYLILCYWYTYIIRWMPVKIVLSEHKWLIITASHMQKRRNFLIIRWLFLCDRPQVHCLNLIYGKPNGCKKTARKDSNLFHMLDLLSMRCRKPIWMWYRKLKVFGKKIRSSVHFYFWPTNYHCLMKREIVFHFKHGVNFESTIDL